MKNAYVTSDHHGDNGTVREGMILGDMTQKRFDELEKLGLVREATAAEVEKGYEPKIDNDPTKAEGQKQAEAPANKKAATPANKAA
ncbi:hypothetical protein [Sphingomonas sp. BK235]|uniref:hypothetical protein n=1 Tax=Sphingomonas sp. BK235 TaxID=2512131 RepID=UPI001046B9C5|nr:hypothetical protein [Sphingomonas sp. BK235]TCP36543.1 hypothetical protein EV292_10139 [Sphingomonas sp. BK235]